MYDDGLTDSTTIEDALNNGQTLLPFNETYYNKTVTKYTSADGQTTFNAEYKVNQVKVIHNGVNLTTDEFVAVDGQTVVLLNAAQSGDNIVIESYYIGDYYGSVYGDLFEDGVISGLEITTSPNLTGTFTEGVLYNDGVRQDVMSKSHIFTASKDTYVDVQSNGDFLYNEVDNGASEPSIVDGNMRIAKVITDVDNISGIDDMRNIISKPLTNQISQDVYFNGNSIIQSSYIQTDNVLVPDATTHIIDYSQGSVHDISCPPSSSMTIELSGFPAGKASEFTLFITDGGQSSITWPQSTLFEGGLKPGLSSNGLDILKCIVDKDGYLFVILAGTSFSTLVV